MKWLVSSLILACSALAPAPARACDTTETATPESECVVMEREGVRGVWFDLDTADELRKYKLQIPELKLQIEALEKRADVRDFQMNTYKRVIELKDAALTTAEENLEAFARRARESEEDANEAREELDAWYRSPPLWAGIGATIVTGVVVALEIRDHRGD